MVRGGEERKNGVIEEARETRAFMLEKKAREALDGLEIGALGATEVEEALGVIARGMRDNPIHVVVFGENPERRRKSFRRLVGAAFAAKDVGSHMLVARSADGEIVGVCGMMPPGDCKPGLGDALHVLPGLLRNGPRAAGRTVRWFGAWSGHDPKTRHWHVGPVAVEAHLQGMGIGSKLMRVFSARMDALDEDAYLETDKPENVYFYERFGFEVVGEEEVLGVPTWFMLRQKRRDGEVPGSSPNQDRVKGRLWWR